MTIKTLINWSGVAAYCASSLLAEAASLQIAPVSVSVSYPAQAAKIDLANLGKEKIDTQVRAYRWTQKGGEDVLEPASDIAVSPPQASIGAGDQQVVRIVQLGKPLAGVEASYRLAIDELPTKSATAEGASNVSFIVRYSVPAFFASDDAHPHVNWSVQSQPGMLVIRAVNDGSRHIRVSRLRATISGKMYSFGDGLNGYVLAKSEKVWRINIGSDKLYAKALIQADSDGGPVSAEVSVASSQ